MSESAVKEGSADPWNPCLTCGACCAYYRVSFYWAECDDAPGGAVPAGMTVQLTPFRRMMRGTERTPPRCVALLGEVGDGVRCVIYDKRSTTCREFPFSWGNGAPNDRCDKARAHFGLGPVTPPVVIDPGKLPKAA